MIEYVGLIGYPLAHSISPRFQQAAFDYLGLEVGYQVWETEPDQLPAAIEGLRRSSNLGANVTVPYKEAVVPLLDELDELARQIGAVNTIVDRDGRLAGHNTDAGGFLRALRGDGGFDPEGRRVVLLGAGGIARAAGFALVGARVRSLTIVNRTRERAEALAAELSHTYQTGVLALPLGDKQVEKVLAATDLLVNCTSVGMKHSPTEGQSPLEAILVPKQALVYDLVYNPAETQFLREAKEAGARTLGGLPMLVYQGAASFELWTGRQAPLDVMFAAANEALELN